MDVRAMEFGEGSFDTVIDKACFDSVVVLFVVIFSVVRAPMPMHKKCWVKSIGFWQQMANT